VNLVTENIVRWSESGVELGEVKGRLEKFMLSLTACLRLTKTNS